MLESMVRAHQPLESSQLALSSTLGSARWKGPPSAMIAPLAERTQVVSQHSTHLKELLISQSALGLLPLPSLLFENFPDSLSSSLFP